MSQADRIGPPCPFRAVGYTWRAGFYPMTPEATSIIAEHNGVRPDQLPRGARNHSNPYMRDWIQALGELKAAGLPYRHESGRFLAPSEMSYDDDTL